MKKHSANWAEPFKIRMKALLVIFSAFFFFINFSNAQQICQPVGWATQNGGTTGGGNASPITVRSLSELQDAASSSGSKVIYVEGTIDGNSTVEIASDKTIFGLPGAKLIGRFEIKDVHNVILRNMIVQGPGAKDVDGDDCVLIQNSTNVWVDHCEIYDGQDGNLDIVNGSNYISVTYTKFHYTSASSDHMYSNLIGNSDSKTSDRGKLKTTLQYNWWADGVIERMPRVRFGQVHVVNNLVTSSNSNYAVRAGKEADLLIESNVYLGTDDPIEISDGDAVVTERNNIFDNTSGSTSGNGNSFTPPYSLNVTDVNQVEEIVRSGAGATLSNPDCDDSSDDNQVPEVAITSPTANSDFTAPATVTVEVNASDADGSVVIVEFFEGGNFLGSDNSAPFTFDWNNVSEGTYSITAKATDNWGASNTSSSVSFAVNDENSGGDDDGGDDNNDCGSGVQFGLIGYATQNGGTTGGQGGSSVTVNTGTDLQNAIKEKGSEPLTIYINGTITPDNSSGLSKIDVKDVSDISIIGVGTSGELNGIGIKVTRASNIIIQNLKIHHVLIGDKDCISIEGPADHVWVDHCELYNDYEGVDKDYYDGLLDAKAEAEYITFSWNYLHDSWKASLAGSSESDTYDRKITYHHNYFENINSRLPLFRGGNGHVFNNYYKNVASTAINSRLGACVKIENNYFENVNNPFVTAYSDEDGYGDISGNELVNSPFSYSDDTRELPACNSNIPYQYSSFVNSALEVPSVVQQYSGVGKLELNPGSGDCEANGFVLEVTANGSGAVTKSPDLPDYEEGTNVTLTAEAASGWIFTGWSGDIIDNNASVTVNMDSDKNITATFALDNSQSNTVIQMEEACSFNGAVEVEHSGFAGSGYVNTDNLTDSEIKLAFYSSVSGVYPVELKYANGGTEDRPVKILVNGVETIASVDFPVTNDWASWRKRNVNLELEEGNNIIQFIALTDNGAPNLDEITIVSGDVGLGSCVVTGNTFKQINSLKFYPNPFNHKLTINMPDNYSYKILDVQGVVLEKGVGSGSTEVGEGLISGLYILQVDTPGGVKVFKINKN